MLPPCAVPSGVPETGPHIPTAGWLQKAAAVMHEQCRFFNGSSRLSSYVPMYMYIHTSGRYTCTYLDTFRTYANKVGPLLISPFPFFFSFFFFAAPPPSPKEMHLLAASGASRAFCPRCCAALDSAQCDLVGYGTVRSGAMRVPWGYGRSTEYRRLVNGCPLFHGSWIEGEKT